MLLVRFVILIFAAVAAIVGVAVFDTWWAVLVATLLLLALLATTIIQVFHFLSASGNRSAADEELLEAGGFVDDDSGLPTRRRWNEYAARVFAAEVADRGTIRVPEDWEGPGAERRVLLVATAPVDARRFTAEALDGDDRDVGVLVIVPTLADRPLRVFLGDASEAVPHAESVLDETLDALRGAGIRANGHIGATDPAVAVSNGLRTYDADLVVVARRRGGAGRHLENTPVEGAAEAFGVPLREIDLSRRAVARVPYAA